MCVYTVQIGMRRDVGGWGRDPRKQKDLCTTVKKRPKQKISWALEVGVCYKITGTRFPYYISSSTIQWAHGNSNLFGTNRTTKWVPTWKSEGRVSTVWISTPAPHVSMRPVWSLTYVTYKHVWSLISLSGVPSMSHMEYMSLTYVTCEHMWVSRMSHMNIYSNYMSGGMRLETCNQNVMTCYQNETHYMCHM